MRILNVIRGLLILLISFLVLTPVFANENPPGYPELPDDWNNSEHTNNPPVANAGPDQKVSLNTQVILDGSSSYDPDNQEISYHWSQVSGPMAVSFNYNAEKPTFIPSSSGVYIFELIVTNEEGASSQPDYVRIDVEPSKDEQGLEIVDVDVTIDGSKATNLKNGERISKKAKPDSDIEFEIEIKNTFADGIIIKDAYVKVIIEDIDDGDNLKEESREFDLDPLESKKLGLDFRVPTLVDEGNYKVKIYAEGIATDGTQYKSELELTLQVRKEKHKITIGKFYLYPQSVSCDRDIKISVTILNLGREEEKAKIEIANNNLGLYYLDDNINLKTNPDEAKYNTLVSLGLREGVRPGVYPIKLSVYYDNNLADSRTINLNVNQCERIKAKSKTMQSLTKQRSRKYTLQGIKKKTPYQTSAISYKEDKTPLFLLLVILFIIVVGGIIFLIGVIIILLTKLKK